MQLSRKAFVGAVVATLAVGIAVGAFATSRTASDRRSLMLAQALPPVQAPILPVQMPLTTGTFAKVAEAIKPAVINVNIVMRGGAGGPAGRTPIEEFFGDDFFRRFFGDAQDRPQRSLGSGVIIDPSGIALTNAHVVEKATDIEVITLDGGKHKAKVIGSDKKTTSRC